MAVKVYVFDSSGVENAAEMFRNAVKAELHKVVRKWEWKDIDPHKITFGLNDERGCDVLFIDQSVYHERIEAVLDVFCHGETDSPSHWIENEPESIAIIFTETEPDSVENTEKRNVYLATARYVSRRAGFSTKSGTSRVNISQATVQGIIKRLGYKPQVKQWPENGFDGTY